MTPDGSREVAAAEAQVATAAAIVAVTAAVAATTAEATRRRILGGVRHHLEAEDIQVQ